MLYQPHSRLRQARRGAAVVELAVVLPLLTFLFLVATDYCRLFYFSQVITNCARIGALHCGDPYSAAYLIYPDVETAAKADAPASMRADMTVTSTPGTDSFGPFVSVTVSYPFTTTTNYPGIPKTVVITRTVQTRLAPAAPN